MTYIPMWPTTYVPKGAMTYIPMWPTTYVPMWPTTYIPMGLRRDHNYSGWFWGYHDINQEFGQVEVPEVVHCKVLFHPVHRERKGTTKRPGIAHQNMEGEASVNKLICKEFDTAEGRQVQLHCVHSGKELCVFWLVQYHIGVVFISGNFISKVVKALTINFCGFRFMAPANWSQTEADNNLTVLQATGSWVQGPG